ncbi:MAG: ferrous iron transport protein A [Caldiserica bacterium]|nr:ferrous iron transport protein A [Caldisericota bacterium]
MRETTETIIDKSCSISSSATTMATATQNTIYVVTGFKDCSQRQRLSNIGLGLGALIEIISNIPGKPLVVFARGTRLAVSRKIASGMFVRHENN